MPLHYRVLGQPGRDNALWITVDTGQSQHHLLFDCGEGCLAGQPPAAIQEIELLCFSHFHIDHVAGFDSFFRFNWYRAESPVQILGPAGTKDIVQHRALGVTWNLVDDCAGELRVGELDGRDLRWWRLLAREGFAEAHPLSSEPWNQGVYAGTGFRVEGCLTDHGTPSAAYVVREEPRQNINMGELGRLALPPGPWLKAVKDSQVPDETTVEIKGAMHQVGELRKHLLETRPGDSIAHLTDFRLADEASSQPLLRMLAGCRTVVCENNYRNADRELAHKNYHMTSEDVGRLAARAQPEGLVLFHLSDRYTVSEWLDQLGEVQQHFPRAEFPGEWRQLIEAERTGVSH